MAKTFKPVLPEEVLDHWNSLRLQDQFTDVQIYCADMRCVKMHSAILATCR